MYMVYIIYYVIALCYDICCICLYIVLFMVYVMLLYCITYHHLICCVCHNLLFKNDIFRARGYCSQTLQECRRQLLKFIGSGIFPTVLNVIKLMAYWRDVLMQIKIIFEFQMHLAKLQAWFIIMRVTWY